MGDSTEGGVGSGVGENTNNSNGYTNLKPSKAQGTHTHAHTQNVASGQACPWCRRKSHWIGAGRAGVAPVRSRRHGGAEVPSNLLRRTAVPGL